jgi:hypothetical protein
VDASDVAAWRRGGRRAATQRHAGEATRAPEMSRGVGGVERGGAGGGRGERVRVPSPVPTPPMGRVPFADGSGFLRLTLAAP